MKRFHVHLTVENIKTNIDFYSKLFGQQPTKRQDDYAKWILEDPHINFAISANSHSVGVNHFGFQVDSQEEFVTLKKQAEAAFPNEVLNQGETACCYAKSEKHWTIDPQGLAWEHFHTMADTLAFGDDIINQVGACCIPVRGSGLGAPIASAACCIPNGSSMTDGVCCD